MTRTSGSLTGTATVSVGVARQKTITGTASVAVAGTGRTKTLTATASVEPWRLKIKLGGSLTDVVPYFGGKPLVAAYLKTATSGDYSRPPTLTWPRQRGSGAFGTYMPDELTAGLPSEYKSQLSVWEGDKTVTDPFEVLDLMEIRGNLKFNVPYMNTQPDRLWVRGRSDYTTSTGLVQFMYANPTGQITLKNSTIEPLVTSEWTRGIEGWWYMAESCYIRDCQDGMMPRTNAATGVCNAGDRGTLIDWLTYFKVALSRASSGQTHNDCCQLNGANGYTGLGSKYYARYGPRGQFQPTILQDVSQSPIFNPYNTHPETAGVQVNWGSTTSTRSMNLLFSKMFFYGGYFPFNFGDSLNDGSSIGEISDCVFDSDFKRLDGAGNPIVINGRIAQPLTMLRNAFVGAYAGRTVTARLG